MGFGETGGSCTQVPTSPRVKTERRALPRLRAVDLEHHFLVHHPSDLSGPSRLTEVRFALTCFKDLLLLSLTWPQTERKEKEFLRPLPLAAATTLCLASTHPLPMGMALIVLSTVWVWHRPHGEVAWHSIL